VSSVNPHTSSCGLLQAAMGHETQTTDPP